MAQLRIEAVNVYIAESTAAAVARIRALLNESEKQQNELARLSEDFERLQGRIADIGSPKLRDSAPSDREERQA